MHVRRLQLLGFKTFALKTTFEFQRGITAIVGPNGSGKSNLADALRWVLGEQSYSTLRSRRTEDVIFSGSSVRPPLGMAEVTLVLDNEDGALPLEFPEVEITRRAYRSGANEYFLNRHRVRLQDIEEVLGGLSSSYVVIHQGLVDEALSLRPRERRLLLEEAAEVRRYHERREKALERLRRTQGNMLRISDVRAELGPRLRLLERQSQQARERSALEASLYQSLRAWYRRRWEQAHTALAQAVEQQQQAHDTLNRLQESLEKALTHAGQLRQALQETQRRAEAQRRQEAELRQRETALRQEMARAEGEQRALERYQQELRKQMERWQQEAAQQAERQKGLEEMGLTLSAQSQRTQASLQEREEALHRSEAGLRLAEQERQQLQQLAEVASGHIREVERRLQYLATRAEGLSREESDRQALVQGLAEARRRVEQEKAAVEAELAEAEVAWQALEAQLAALQAEIAQVQEERLQAEAGLEQARLSLAEARARQEALTQTAGSDAAAFLEDWARRKSRSAWSTVLANVTIPPGLGAAVEAALGGSARALVLGKWSEVRAALQALSTAQAGRATLLPQEDLRPPSSTLPTTPILGSEGLLLDHLTFPEKDRPALACLIGQTVLARDLGAARRVAAGLPAGWTVVTRQGDVVTATGVVHGGPLPAEQRPVLLERERQTLARAIATAESMEGMHEQARQETSARLAEHQQALASLEHERQEKRARREELAQKAREMARDLERGTEEQARHQERLQALEREKVAMAREYAGLRRRLKQLQAEHKSVQARLEQAEQAVLAVRAEHERARDLWQEARAAWLLAEKEMENRQALEEMARRSAAQLQEQIADGERRLGQAQSQFKGWEARVACLQTEIEQVAGRLATLTETAPAPQSLDELARIEGEVARQRQAMLEAQNQAGRADMEVERQRDFLREVLRRGLAELGPEASAYGAASEALLNAMLEDPPEWTRAPLDPTQTVEDLERRIAHLREEVRRVGPVNPLAEEEYRETAERYQFLGRQLQDLHDASRSLEQVIAELDQAMEQRFEQTFEAINREFQAYFTRLFGGGTASLRLVRLDGEQEGGLAGLGVEIIARPPGKRAHTLALLSGGERALASSALLFAILKVNPRPFCLLDEVDAMLDEANVGRFRECLEELSGQTQFIVITHNRGTVEAAQTLYGVSMSEDGTSKVLSLRLEEVAS